MNTKIRVVHVFALFRNTHVRNNGNIHVQIIKILDFMQILCHQKVGKDFKILRRGWEEFQVGLGNIHPWFQKIWNISAWLSALDYLCIESKIVYNCIFLPIILLIMWLEIPKFMTMFITWHLTVLYTYKRIFFKKIAKNEKNKMAAKFIQEKTIHVFFF